MPSRDEYLRVLELDGRASIEQIKKAYRQLAKVWHPDRFANETDLDLRRKAAEKLTVINEAFKKLSSSANRQEPTYSAPSPPPTPPPRPSTYPPPRRAPENPFAVDIRDGEEAEIVAISPEDDYFSRREFFVGGRVVVKNPIHKGNGWYSVHASFRSGSRQIASFADGTLFARVRLRRI